MTLVLAVACGDDDPAADAGGNPDASVVDGSVPPDAEVPDAIQYDAIYCPAQDPGEPGSTCNNDADCDSAPNAGDGFCLRGAAGPVNWPTEGFCVRFCSDDTNCGGNGYCATIDSSINFTACMPKCCLDVACPDGQACNSTFFANEVFAEPTCMPGDPDAIDGDRCMGFYDCAPQSICRRDALEQPGGSCHRINCTVGDDTTCAEGGDGHCIAHELGDLCVDTCTDDTDCNEGQGWRCTDHGADGMYCTHPEAGDPCTVATDCGNAPPWTCFTGAEFPGGYCTVTPCNSMNGTGCSPGSSSSTCFDPDLDPLNPDNDEYCVDRCDPNDPMSCRVGYQCAQFVVGNSEGGTTMFDGCIPE